MGELKSLMRQEDIAKRNLEERVADLTAKSNEYQKIINELSTEVRRLNDVLKAKLVQIG